MPIETEIKLSLPGVWTLPPLLEDERIAAALMAAFTATKMRSVYYDTEQGFLDGRKWALRLRCEGGRSVACVKTTEAAEGSLFVRNEWQVWAEDWESALPLLVEAGAPSSLLHLPGELLPRCAIEFTRTAAPLRLPDGSTAEIALDEGSFSAGEKSEPLLELELELLSGDVSEMLELADYLEEKYALSKELNSKLARALRLVRSR